MMKKQGNGSRDIYIFVATALTLFLCSCHTLQATWPAKPVLAYQAHQPDESEILDVVRNSVVQIVVAVPPGTKIKNELASRFRDGVLLIGTGVFVNEKGDVLTAAHVVNDAAEKLQQLQSSGDPAFLAVGLPIPSTDGAMIIRNSTTFISVQSSATENRYDLGLLSAMITLRSTPRPPAPPGIARMPSPVRLPITISVARPPETSKVFACDYVASSPVLRTSVGTIASAWDSAVPVEADRFGGQEQLDLFQATIGFNPGASGGPVFRASDGALIGIIVEGRQNNLVTIIPSRYVVDFLKHGDTQWYPSKLP